MRRRRLLSAVGTSSVLGIAGCLGSDDGGGTENQSSTDDESSDDDGGTMDDEEEPEPSLETFSFPEHATREELDAAAFADAHFEAVEEAGSVTVSGTLSELARYQREEEFEYRLSSDGLVETRSDGSVDETLWTELGGNRGFLQRSTGFRTGYQITTETPRPERAIRQSRVEAFVNGFDFGEAAEVVEIDGTLTARYDVSGVADESVVTRFVERGEVELQNETGSVFVAEDGELRRISYEVEFRSRGEDVKRIGELTYSGIGDTTVAEPDWVATAREEGREFRSAMTDDGFLEFELVNGTPIPEGSHLFVSTDGTAELIDRQLRTDVSIGDRIVVASSDSGLSAGINERPTSTSEFAGRFANLYITDGELPVYEGGTSLRR